MADARHRRKRISRLGETQEFPILFSYQETRRETLWTQNDVLITSVNYWIWLSSKSFGGKASRVGSRGSEEIFHWKAAHRCRWWCNKLQHSITDSQFFIALEAGGAERGYYWTLSKLFRRGLKVVKEKRGGKGGDHISVLNIKSITSSKAVLRNRFARRLKIFENWFLPNWILINQLKRERRSK